VKTARDNVSGKKRLKRGGVWGERGKGIWPDLSKTAGTKNGRAVRKNMAATEKS